MSDIISEIMSDVITEVKPAEVKPAEVKPDVKSEVKPEMKSTDIRLIGKKEPTQLNINQMCQYIADNAQYLKHNDAISLGNLILNANYGHLFKEFPDGIRLDLSILEKNNDIKTITTIYYFIKNKSSDKRT